MAAVGSYLVLISIVTGAILAVQQWFIPRFNVRSDTVRRLVTLGLAGPVLAGSIAALTSPAARWATTSLFFFGQDQGGLSAMADSIPALLAGLLCVDWNRRVRPDRPEQVSLGAAFSAGVFGLVAAAIARGDMGLTFGLLAALSLVLNTVTPHTPPPRKALRWARRTGRRLRGLKKRSSREYESL